MFNPTRHIALSAFFTLLIGGTAFFGGTVYAQMTASYLYRLSDFSGPVESLWARIAVDKQMGEIYTLNRSDSIVEVYNQTAMRTYDFGEEMQLTSATDIATGDNGETYLLYRSPAGTIKHLDYRGTLIKQLQVNLADFQPNFIDYHNGKLYLADGSNMKVVIAAQQGEVEQTYDFRENITDQIKANSGTQKLNKAQRKKIREDLESLKDASWGGFSVDANGNLYFTLSSLFTAYRYNTDGQLQAFGIPGSAAGKFGVVASICADKQGHVFVSDRLRCVVLMFDDQLNFQSEFGYRGPQPQNLVVPDDIAIDEREQRIYVAQAANRGVSVFSYAAPVAKAQKTATAKQHLANNPERRSENETSQTATVDM